MTRSLGRSDESRRLKAILDNRRRGLCGCGARLESGTERCSSCRTEQLQRDAERYAERVINGLCLCGALAIGGLTRCAACAETESQRSRERRKRLVAQGLCSVCGREPLLTKTLGAVCIERDRRYKMRRKPR